MSDITKGTSVHTASGDHVGDVDRVVLDPVSGVVTHLVVRKGLILTEDKLIRTDDIATATDDRINLDERVDMDDLKPFVEHYYVPVDGIDATAAPRPTDIGFRSAWYGPLGIDTPAYEDAVRTVVERNIPDRLLALETGTPVFSADRHELGRFDGVRLTESDRPTHIVVESGAIRHERRAVPINWVEDITEDAVSLGTPRRLVEDIPPMGSDG